eukprot:g368.t1
MSNVCIVAILLLLGSELGAYASKILRPVNVAVNGLRRRSDLMSSPFNVHEPIVLSWDVSLADTSLISNKDDVVSYINVKRVGGREKEVTSIRVGENGTSSFRQLEGLSPASSYAITVASETYTMESIIFETSPSNFSTAKWIGGGSEVRTTWSIHLQEDDDVSIERARAYASGLGAFELSCDGAKLGEGIMDPGQAVYDRKTLYVGFDLTPCLQRNSFPIISSKIGNGKFGYLDIYANRTLAKDQSGDSTRAFILYAFAELSNGTTLHLVSDPGTWSYRHGPIVYDHMWHGEIYDARQEDDAWVTPAFEMNPIVGTLVPQNMPPIRITETSTPISVRIDRESLFATYDSGRNGAGLCTLVLTPKEGDTGNGTTTTFAVRMEHTEIEGASGVPYNNYFPGMEFNHASKTCSMGDWYERKWYECANQTDAFIFTTSSDRTEGFSYTPTFTYHGFRFVRVNVMQLHGDGSTSSVSLSDFPFDISIQVHRAHSDLESRAHIDLAQPQTASATAKATSFLLASIFNATVRSHTSNVWSIPTDCPQREKRGWMGDAGISSLSLSTLFDASAFNLNFLQRIADNQEKGCTDQPQTTINGPCTHVDPKTQKDDAATFYNGSVPDVVPFSTSPYGTNPGTVDWQASFVTIARNLIVSEPSFRPFVMDLWSNLVQLMDYYERLVDERTGLLLVGARGDWIPPPDTSQKTGTAPVAAFFHTLCVQHMSEIARALGLSAEAAQYKDRFRRNVAAYHDMFYNENTSTCCYETGSQTNNAFALFLGIPPTDAIRNATIDALVRSIAHHAPPNGGSDWAPGPHLDMGIFGTTFVFDVLVASGKTDVAFDVLNQTSYPSFGYFVAQNATTLWETWAGTTHAIGQGGTSRNHIMYGGGVNLFILHEVVGLPREFAQRAFWTETHEVTIRPAHWATRHLARASGEINGLKVTWEKSESAFEMQVHLPPNTYASVFIPLLADEPESTVVVAMSSATKKEQNVTCETARCASGYIVVSTRITVCMLLHTYVRAESETDDVGDAKRGREDWISAHLPTSALGLYVRRFALAYEKMSFSALSRLFEDLTVYVRDATEGDVSTKCSSGSSFNAELSLSVSKLSRAQLQAYLASEALKVTSVVGTGDNHPGVTQAEISRLLELQPNLPQAYLFRYLNCMASQNLTGALDALHRYFDYALSFGRGAALAGSDGRFRLQYASLNLAVLHFRFGHVSESFTAIQEAIRVAQQHGDRRCIARALFWLYHIASATRNERAVLLLQRCRSQAAALGLHALERLAALNLAARRVVRPSHSRSASKSSEMGASGSPSIEDAGRTQYDNRSIASRSAAVWNAVRSDPVMESEDVLESISQRRTLGSTKDGNDDKNETKQPQRRKVTSRVCDENDAHVLSRAALLRSAIWEAYGNSSMSREALFEHLQLTGRCDADATCFAMCKLAMLHGSPDDAVGFDAFKTTTNDCVDERSENDDEDGLSDRPLDDLVVGGSSSSSSRGDSTHARTIRVALRASHMFPHASSVPSLAWPRTLCLALFNRSLMRGEWSVAEMACLQINALSLPTASTAAQILACAKRGEGKSESVLGSLLSAQSSASDSGATCEMFVESCFCSVQLMAARQRWEDALRTIDTLIGVCESFDLIARAASLRCEAGRLLLRSVPTQPAKALGPLLKAFAICTRSGQRLVAANCAVVLAELHLRLGNTSCAIEMMREHLAVVLEHGGARDRGLALKRMAEIRMVESKDGSVESSKSAAGYLSRALVEFVRAEDSENALKTIYMQSRMWHHLEDEDRRDAAALRWSAVSKYREEASRASAAEYQFLNRIEKLERDLERDPNPLYRIVYR